MTQRSPAHFIEILCSTEATSNRPYVLIERYQTTDGQRTRVIGERFDTLTRAEGERTARLERMKP